MSYAIDEHRERFATWAAARAAQRGWARTPVLEEALHTSGVMAVVRGDPADWPDSVAAVDARHREWCDRIVGALNAHGIARTTYGRAAK